MKLKYKHLTYEDRCIIQEFLNHGYNFTKIGNRINKNRTTVAKEIYSKRYKRLSRKITEPCLILNKAPYVCNGCPNKVRCSKEMFLYDANVAQNDYRNNLINSRSTLRITKEQIATINDIISPLMIYKHHSINQVYIEHPEFLPFSKSTFYKYIDLGILNVRNIDLHRKVRYKVKKEKDNEPRFSSNPKIKIGRFYSDFKDYIEYHPNASIVEMDTVIGTSGGKGGKCMLTLLFRQFNFMLIYLMPYKRCEHVTAVFEHLKKLLGIDEFRRLFEVILTDNGSEFFDPDSIEIDFNTGEKVVNLFYCDPNCSWQKGSIEKNHEYIRYILPKGTSFASLTQDDCFLLASHINSVPRCSLNNYSPFNAAKLFIGEKNIAKLSIKNIDYDDINLTYKLLEK